MWISMQLLGYLIKSLNLIKLNNNNNNSLKYNKAINMQKTKSDMNEHLSMILIILLYDYSPGNTGE